MKMAANKGLFVAQHNLGTLYLDGIIRNGKNETDLSTIILKPNVVLGLEYWKMAAAKDFPPSLINLGKMYSEGITINGINIPQDFDLAKSYLSRAAMIDNQFKKDAMDLLHKLGEKEKEKSTAKNHGCIMF